MDSKTIERINSMIAQNTQMNRDLTELLTLANTGWQSDLDGIAIEVQKEKDAVHQEVTDLTTRAETAEAKVIEKETEITTLQARVATLETAPVEEIRL